MSSATDPEQREDYLDIIDGNLAKIAQSSNPFNPTIIVNQNALTTFTAECVARVSEIGQEASNYFTLWWFATLERALEDTLDAYLGIIPDLSAGALSGSD